MDADGCLTQKLKKKRRRRKIMSREWQQMLVDEIKTEKLKGNFTKMYVNTDFKKEI